MFKAILYDHDGTLINTEIMHYGCWRDLLAAMGHDFPLELYTRYCNGVPTLQNAEYLIEAFALPHSAADLCEQKQRLTRGRFKDAPCPLMPFAEETIKASHQAGYQLAIATGSNRVEIQQTFTAYPLEHYFSAVATRDDVDRGKPAPDVYQHALSLLKCDAEAGVAVEDTATGIASAKSAGLTCVAVRNAFSDGQDLSAADFLCDSLQDALRWIQSAPQ